MALADELLDSISEEQSAEFLSVETNPHIVIDEDRNIILPERYKIIAAQGDHDMTTYTFDCPRFSDGRDMSKMVVYINYIRSDGETGSYPADNVSIDAQNTDLMHFDWTLLLPATIAEGVLAFLVCVCRTGNNGKIENHWSSRICREAMISEGMDCHTDTIVDLYPDIITRILERLNVLEDGGTTSVQYTIQDLEEEQKVQARKNIAAAAASEVSKLSEENAELKGDINSGKVGQESLVRSKMSYYNVVDTNLIGKENGYDFIDGYYYSPSAGYIAREGYRCIFMVPIKSNTTYYASCSSYVLFDANKNKTGNGDAPASGIAQFTTGNNDKYITLNFSESYTDPPVQGWFLSEINGTQHRKVYDRELAISDDNFKDFEMNMSEIINKVRMSCKLVESVASIEDMITNIKASISTRTGIVGKGNILNESRFVAGSSKTITEITKTLKQPIKGSDFESITVVLYLPYETLNAESSSGGYYQIYLNGNSQLGTYLNGRTTFGWNFVKLDRDEFPKLTDDTVITSIQLKLTPRNNVPIEGIFGESYLNALLFNLRVKPTVLLSFDQIWEESLNNGCYDMAYNREIPYSLYMIYDNLTQNEKNLIEKYKNFAEFSLYGSITGKNGFLWDDTGFPTMKSKLDLLERGIEYGESEVKQPFTTYAVSQTEISPLGYVALSHTNLKCARLIYDKLPVAYFDASNRLISSTGVDQKTGEYVNAIIDRAVKYGSIASIFLHGVRDDGNDNSIISGKGMDKSEYTIMLNHIRELRNNGKIQVMTYSDFVNACIN